MTRLVLALALLAAPACMDKETGKGADTKAGEGARAGAPIGENRMPDAGAAPTTAKTPTPGAPAAATVPDAR